MNEKGNGEQAKPQVVAVMQIALLSSGQITLTAPMEQQELCLQMLFGAMKIVAKFEKPKSNIIPVSGIPLELSALKGHSRS